MRLRCKGKQKVRLSIATFGILMLTVFAANAGTPGNQGDYDHSKKSHGSIKHSKTNQKSRKKLTHAARESLISALVANESLHQAFFDYDGKIVEAKAKRLGKLISAITDEQISKLLKFSQSKLDEIKAANDREVNNENYHLVSMALIHIINKYDVDKKYNAYSCSMVKKKWVQNSEKMLKVHNPYAPNMPHCGSQDTRH